MDNIIAYVDDAGYALHQLKPMGASTPASASRPIGSWWPARRA